MNSSHAFFSFFLLALLSSTAGAVEWPRFQVRPLGHAWATGLGMSPTGAVVGYEENKAVRISRSGSKVVLHQEPASASYAFAINRMGQAVGHQWIFSGKTEIAEPVLWEKGEVIPLGTFVAPAQNGSARSINAFGEVVGYSLGVNAAGGTTPQAFIWKNGQLSPLPKLVGDYNASEANAINNKRSIAGEFSKFRTYSRTAVLWLRNGKIVDIGARIPGRTSIAVGLNNRDQVIGFSYTPMTLAQGFIYFHSENRLMTLAALNDKDSHPISINNKGWVVGHSNRKAALWIEGQVAELQMLSEELPNCGDFTVARTVTDSGQILVNSTGCGPVILEPITESPEGF